MRRLILAGMPTLAMVGLTLTVFGAVQNIPVLVGAGLVILGMWSGAAVAELFTMVARPTGLSSSALTRTGESHGDEGGSEQ